MVVRGPVVKVIQCGQGVILLPSCYIVVKVLYCQGAILLSSCYIVVKVLHCCQVLYCCQGAILLSRCYFVVKVHYFMNKFVVKENGHQTATIIQSSPPI